MGVTASVAKDEIVADSDNETRPFEGESVPLTDDDRVTERVFAIVVDTDCDVDPD